MDLKGCRNNLLLRDIGITDQSIEVETIDGFTEKNGSILIDNEIIYYESVSRGPDAILTPGISYDQFKKKEQQLENPFSSLTALVEGLI